MVALGIPAKAPSSGSLCLTPIVRLKEIMRGLVSGNASVVPQASARIEPGSGLCGPTRPLKPCFLMLSFGMAVLKPRAREHVLEQEYFPKSPERLS